MRILLVNYEFPPVGGGAGRATWHLGRELSKQDVTVDILTSTGAKKQIFDLNGATVYALPMKKRISEHQTGIYGMLEFLLRSFFFIRHLFSKNKYDVIHYFFSIPTGLLSFFTPKLIPYVVSLRGGDVPGYNQGELQLFHYILKPLNVLIWRKAAAVIALSNDLGEFSRRIEPSLDYSVIYNGVDCSVFKPDSIPKVNNKHSISLLTVSRLLEWKGIQYLLKAISFMKNRKCHLTIVGTGSYEESLKKIVNELSLSERVFFLGAKDHKVLPKIYNQADIFVLPSYGDSFGQVYTEAMACGLPIVAAKSGGVQEFVKHGANGFLVPPKNSFKLAEVLDYLIDNPKLCIDMGTANVKKVSAEFSWQEVAAKYIAIYNQIID